MSKKMGRPRTAESICNLIVKTATETGWGYTRVMDEIRKLGLKPPSRNTVKRILKANNLDPGPNRDDALVHQCGKRVREQLIQGHGVAGAEVGEHVIIDADLAANPHAGQVSRGEPIQMPSTADAFNGGENPESHQNFRVDRIAADATFDGSDSGVERFQVERFHISPNGSDSMVIGNELVERSISPLNLKAFRTLSPHLASRCINVLSGVVHTRLLAP